MIRSKTKVTGKKLNEYTSSVISTSINAITTTTAGELLSTTIIALMVIPLIKRKR